jgi:hypothetical protein
MLSRLPQRLTKRATQAGAGKARHLENGPLPQRKAHRCPQSLRGLAMDCREICGSDLPRRVVDWRDTMDGMCRCEFVNGMTPIPICKCLAWLGIAPIFRAAANRRGRCRNRGRRLPRTPRPGARGVLILGNTSRMGGFPCFPRSTRGGHRFMDGLAANHDIIPAVRLNRGWRKQQDCQDCGKQSLGGPSQKLAMQHYHAKLRLAPVRGGPANAASRIEAARACLSSNKITADQRALQA